MMRDSGHPHVGGEIAQFVFAFRCQSGPSPRGWGNQTSDEAIKESLRAIPTWVGKSHFKPAHRNESTGHPHVGGEIDWS